MSDSTQNSSLIDSPETKIQALQDQATRLESPCGEGVMVWHRWEGPSEQHDRPPLVLLHGGFGSWTHWARAIPLLREHVTVIAADSPGLGDSADAPLPHTSSGLAEIISNGLNHILPSAQRFHLTGFSFGGMLGSVVAARQGNRCLSFTAVGASGFGDLHYIVEGIRMPEPEMTDAEINNLHRDNLNVLMFDDPSSADSLAIYIHRTNVNRARVRSRRLSVSSALVDALPLITARIGGIWGELDVTGGGIQKIRARSDMFRSIQSDACFDVISGAGHWVMYEAAEIFSEKLIQQIQTSDASE